ncbi:putative Neutral alpha-glucosidase AB [Paratrimastix pyriformis]|uniref:Neutral alpha-glucosidase AB n=1 Tax=Paratrimastix pyriformis TaxID=342808 RepID=A0ABQ8UL30_9EUKA|nr:putative Neutral alpha-glucosidase AB [Paratrimastix pyriformis]
MVRRVSSLIFAVLLLFPALISAVDRSKFRKCSDMSFCRRNRNLLPHTAPFQMQPTLRFSERSILGEIWNTQDNVPLTFELRFYPKGIMRLTVLEKEGLKPRPEVPEVLMPELTPIAYELLSHDHDGARIRIPGSNAAISIHISEFRFDVLVDNELVMQLNPRGLFNFEHFRTKQATPVTPPPPASGDAASTPSDATQPPPMPLAYPADTNDMWDERFGSHFDHKPNVSHVPLGHPPTPTRGLTTGLFWFNAAQTFIDVATTTEGVDTHWWSEAGRLDLFVLVGPTPRRVLEQYVSLTGLPALPPLFAMGYHQCRWNYRDMNDVAQVDAGFDEHDIPYDVLWLDIEHTDGKRYFTWDKNTFADPEKMQNQLAAKGRKLVTIVDPHIKRDPNYHVHKEALEQGYYIKNHDGGVFEGHCWPGLLLAHRPVWLSVSASVAVLCGCVLIFFKVRLPGLSGCRDLDLVFLRWVRACHMDETIGQQVTDDAHPTTDRSSSYPDFLAPQVRQWWSRKFGLDQYRGSTQALHIWNDMNEPSVFSGPEITMPSDCLHLNGQEHREVHNIYGFLYNLASANGLAARNPDERYFILTRSFFAGTQRLGAIWTGDNAAKWEHLAATTPMFLSMGISGLPFVGSDVGGFFGNPNEELFVRWYQAGAFHPFFRGHAHIETKRREPWLFSDAATDRIRSAIKQRYQLLPYLYTAFYNASRTGAPVMRPLWFDFPGEADLLGIDDQFLFGGDVLVKPVTQEGQSSMAVRLPGSQPWYDLQSGALVPSGTVTAGLTMDRIPTYQRAGSILPRWDRPRRSSRPQVFDPYTLVIAPDLAGRAAGSLFLDDGHSRAHERGGYWYRLFEFANQRLSSRAYPAPNPADQAPSLAPVPPALQVPSTSTFAPPRIDRVLIRGVGRLPKAVYTHTFHGQPHFLPSHTHKRTHAQLTTPGGTRTPLRFELDPAGLTLAVRLTAPTVEDWVMELAM